MSEALSYAAASPVIAGYIRTVPEDFQVIEELGFAPAGAGEHVFLRVRKRQANTDWVARRLAEFAGARACDVGYAGLKDRGAVTEQWFSVRLARGSEPDWSTCAEADFSILECSRHPRKLRRGALRANIFRIVIRELRGERAELEKRLRRVAAEGVPNYFGAQRFGREGGNLIRAEAMFARRLRVRDRHRRGLYLSAARSHLFNQVLSRRVAQRSWNQGLAGDLMMLEGSRSVFGVERMSAELRERVANFDIHPTGPLWGAGDLPSRAGVRDLEQTVAATFPSLCRGLAEAGLTQERRALRLRVADAGLGPLGEDAVVIHFRLPAGAYATSVLRELVHLSSPGGEKPW